LFSPPADSRLLVQESIYPKVVKKLRDRIQTLRIGNPLDKNTDIGAINNKPQLEKIRELVQCGADEGAEVVQPVCKLPERGYWYPPTFLTGVTASHRVAQEEIFGPVLSVMIPRSRDTPGKAFERANNTPYGLSAGVWTDKESFRHLTPALSPFEAEREKFFKLRVGVVWANTYNKFDPTSLPRLRDGYKESGFGREGGVQGLAVYCRID
jgi:aldehyde dehydrogenase (NAD+)